MKLIEYKKIINNIINNLGLISYFILSFLLIYISTKITINLPFSDQIDLFYDYIDGLSEYSLFMQQHGPERQGFGALLMKLTLWLGNYNFNSIVYLTLSIIILYGYLLLTSAKKFGISNIVTVCILTVNMSLGSVELITITPNISHSALPVLILYTILFLFQYIEKYLLFSCLWIFSIISLFSGFGLFISIGIYITIAVLVIFKKLYFKIGKYELIMAIVSCLLSAIVFADGYNIQRGEGCAANSFANIFLLLKYSSSVASLPVGGSALGSMAFGIGFILLFTYSITLYFLISSLNIENYRKNIPIFLIVLVSCIFIIGSSVGRFCLGVDSAFSSRYYSFSILGLTGVLLYFGNKRFLISAICIVLITLNLYLISPSNFRMGQAYADLKINFLQCIKNSTIENCNENFVIYPPNGKRLAELMKKIH